jgi:hypothetical protein
LSSILIIFFSDFDQFLTFQQKFDEKMVKILSKKTRSEIGLRARSSLDQTSEAGSQKVELTRSSKFKRSLTYIPI